MHVSAAFHCRSLAWVLLFAAALVASREMPLRGIFPHEDGYYDLSLEPWVYGRLGIPERDQKWHGRILCFSLHEI